MKVIDIKQKALVLDDEEIKKLTDVVYAYLNAPFLKGATNHKFAKYMIAKLEEMES